MTATPPSNADDTPAGDSEPAAGGPDQRPRDPAAGVIAVVEQYDDAPDECTISPDVDSRRLLTEWVSAEAAAFVSLDETR